MKQGEASSVLPWYEDEEFWLDFAGLMFSTRRAAQAAELVTESPLLAFPRGTRILDLCCGPGLFVAPLAREGHQVTGVDLSQAMLQRASHACADEGVAAELVREDMHDHVRPGGYDVVLNLFTSFGYFAEPEHNLRVLRNAYESLVPGGQLIVDLLGKEVLAGWVGRPQAVDIDGGVVYMRDTILDDWTRLRTDWTLISGNTARHASITSVLYSAAELRELFHTAGFTTVECFGDFNQAPYDNSAKRLIVRGARHA